MSNPYQSPQSSSFDSKHFQDLPEAASSRDYGWVTQVRIFAILNAVQGGLELPIGLMLTGFAFFIPAMARMDQARNAGSGTPAPPDAMLWAMAGVYLAIGIPVLVGSVLRIAAGVYNFSYRGRTLGIASIIVGMASVFACYCAPTAIAVLVYGLIVHLNPAVRAAFEMRAQGRTPDQILASFMPYRVQTFDPLPPQKPPT